MFQLVLLILLCSKIINPNFVYPPISVLHSNFHILTLEPSLENNILYEVLFGFLYIFKTTFTSFELKFQTIQPIISFVHNTIDKIGLLTLNVSSKPIPRSRSLFTSWISLLLNLYSTLMFYDPVCSTSHFSTLDFNFQIYSRYDNLFRSICVVSFGKVPVLIPEENCKEYSVFQNNYFQFLLS